MPHSFSIIIPVKELNDYIRESLPYILNMSYSLFDVYILPNEYRGCTYNEPVSQKEIAADVYFRSLDVEVEQLKKIIIVPTGKVSPAVKRDLGVNLSGSDVVAFLDDDAYPEKNWLDVADRMFQDEMVHALGGPGITPPQDTPRQKASGLVFETILGGGSYQYRYRPVGQVRRVDDYPSVNLLVRRDAFLNTGGFDSGFWPGEDTKFCMDFVNNGYSILYVSDMCCSNT